MTPDPQAKQTEQEGIDWLYCVIAALVISALVVGCVVGHWWVSLGLGQ